MFFDKMNRRNAHYCRDLINRNVLVTRTEYIPVCKKKKSKKTSYKKNVIWDYPAVAITSYDNNGQYVCSNYSRAAFATSFNTLLISKLNCIDPRKKIGDVRYKNKIGHCAEPHAANQTMNAFRKKNGTDLPLDLVYFSLALRPRTMGVIENCQNCKDTFPNL